MPLQTSGVMVRRSVIEDVGDFDLDLPVVEDWDLWYRIGKTYDVAYTFSGLACNRLHTANLPKYDSTALDSSLRMNLKHLPDVKDPDTRQMLLQRIQRQFVLLQEALLREGTINDATASLLQHELRPRSARYQLGSIISTAPQWLAMSYGHLVRMLGQLKRAT
jgi:hypothetical protein